MPETRRAPPVLTHLLFLPSICQSVPIVKAYGAPARRVQPNQFK